MKSFNEFLIEEGVFSDLASASKNLAKGTAKLAGKALTAPVKFAASEVKNFGKDVKDAFLKPFKRDQEESEDIKPHSPEEIIDIIYNYYLNNPQLLETKTFNIDQIPFHLSDINSTDKEASQLLIPVSYKDKSKAYQDESELNNLQNNALDKIYSHPINIDNIDKQASKLIYNKCKEKVDYDLKKNPKLLGL